MYVNVTMAIADMGGVESTFKNELVGCQTEVHHLQLGRMSKVDI